MNALTPHRLSDGSQVVVTSSDLVRHFGEWQDRAQQSPVYIHHRGRPRLVLVSIDVMSKLCALSEDGEHGDAARLPVVLDAIDELVAVIDNEHRISAIGRRAARYFGTDTGAPATSLSAPVTAPLLDAALARVLASGRDETLDIVGPRAARHLTLDIVADAGATVVIARDASAADELADARAEIHADREALGAIDMLATARVGLRGYVEGSAPLLARMAGITEEALNSVRFVTLFDIGSRVAVGEAVEAVIAGSTSIAVPATLSVNWGAPKRVTVAFAPIRRQGACVALRAVIAEEGSRDETEIVDAT